MISVFTLAGLADLEAGNLTAAQLKRQRGRLASVGRGRMVRRPGQMVQQDSSRVMRTATPRAMTTFAPNQIVAIVLNPKMSAEDQERALKRIIPPSLVSAIGKNDDEDEDEDVVTAPAAAPVAEPAPAAPAAPAPQAQPAPKVGEVDWSVADGAFDGETGELKLDKATVLMLYNDMDARVKAGKWTDEDTKKATPIFKKARAKEWLTEEQFSE